MVWAIEDAPDVPPQCVAVLQGLANHAGRDGRNAFPSIRLLAHYTRKGERAVQKDLRVLEEAGLIRRGDQRAAFDIPERYRPTVWDLAMELRRPPLGAPDRDAAESPRNAGRGERSATPADAVRGELQDAAGVACSSPEPAPITTTTNSDLVSHVSRAAPASPPPAPGGDAAAPSPRVRARPSSLPAPPSSPALPSHNAEWSRLREDLARRAPHADPRMRSPVPGVPAG